MWDAAPVRSRHEQLSAIRSIIDTNAAYQLAEKGLAAIYVDVERLEREHPSKVEQRSFYASDSRERHRVLLPLFDVKWGDWNKPAVKAVVAGNTGDLLDLEQLDNWYSKRPRELIKDVDALLAIPDAEFLSYTPDQRTNLLTRFLAVKYPPVKHLSARPILPFVTLTPTNSAMPPPSKTLPAP